MRIFGGASGGVRGRVARGIGATGFGLAVTVVIQIVGVPVFLHGFGLRLYGEWLVISAVPAYLSLSDLGFVGVAGNEMTMRVAVDDRRGAQAAFQTVWATMTALSSGAAAVVLGGVWLLHPERLLHLELMSHREVALTLSLLLANVLAAMQLTMLEAGFRCAGLFPRGFAGISFVRLMGFAASAIAVVLGAGPVGAAASQVCATSAGFVALRLVMRRDVPWLRFGVRFYSRSLVRRLGGPALAYLSLPIGNSLALQGMVFVVSAELGPAAVVVLNVVRVVVTSIKQLVRVINHAVWPELSRAIAAEEMPLARRLHVGSFRGSVLMTVVIAAALIVGGHPLIKVWTGSAVHPSQAFFQLMILTSVIDAAWLSSLVVLTSVNRHQRIALLYLVCNAAAVGLAATLVPVLGLVAVPLALIGGSLVVMSYVLRSSAAVLRQSPRQLGKELVGPLHVRLQGGAPS